MLQSEINHVSKRCPWRIWPIKPFDSTPNNNKSLCIFFWEILRILRCTTNIMAPVRWGILQYRIYITNSSQTRISRNFCLEYLFHFIACKNLHCAVETLMCKISERLGNWEMSYGQTRFREIWATDDFHRDIHYNDVNSPHKRPVTRKMFPFDDVIMLYGNNVNDAIVKLP